MGTDPNGLSIGTEHPGIIAQGIVQLINIMVLCLHPGPTGFQSFGSFAPKARMLRDFIQVGIAEGDIQRDRYCKRYELFRDLGELVMYLDGREEPCPACARNRDGIRALVSAFGRKI